MSKLLPLEAAQQRLLDMATAPTPERLATNLASGRYLAKDLAARRTQPARDLSAMDGYAIFGNGPWTIIGESRAGHPFNKTLSHGEAIRISTGAMMPEGADRVLIQEDATIDGKNLSISHNSPASGQHIRRQGFDFVEGDILLKRGTLLGAPQIALALAAGHSMIELHSRPRLALIESGDELAALANNCAVHQIPASNNAMIAAMAEPLCFEIGSIGPVTDTIESLISALESAASADIIVTSGGASVGDHDLVRPALEAWGAQIEFWKVAIRPGKPLLVARRGEQLVIGLPGNPVSSFVTAFLFLLPLLRQMSGAGALLPSKLFAACKNDIAAGGSRREFLRATWDGSSVTPINEQDSSALLSLASANALIERPENCNETKAGTSVPFYLLQNGGIA